MIFSFTYSNKYTSLAEHTEYLELRTKLENQSDIESLRKVTLHLHESTIMNAKDNSDGFMNLAEMFLSFSLIILFTLYGFYKYTVSNKSSNLTGANDAPSS